MRTGSLNDRGQNIDGYQGYHTVDNESEDLKVSGCWIHCHKPFADFIKSMKRNKASTFGHHRYGSPRDAN